MFQTLSSLSHPAVQRATRLRKEKKFRYEEKKLLLSGMEMVEEFQGHIETLFSLSPIETLEAEHRYQVTLPILAKMTGLPSPENMAAIVSIPPFSSLDSQKYLVVLDGLSDPGNLGTLIRTAAAFGWEGVVATDGSVDWFNDKALRAAKGATFHIPLISVSREELLDWLRRKEITPWVADLKGASLETISPRSSTVLVLSHEKKGPFHWARENKEIISIPMVSTIDSLNVAVAGGILLHELRPPL